MHRFIEKVAEEVKRCRAAMPAADAEAEAKPMHKSGYAWLCCELPTHNTDQRCPGPVDLAKAQLGWRRAEHGALRLADVEVLVDGVPDLIGTKLWVRPAERACERGLDRASF